mgnify:CR=1 FL=1
MKQQAIDYVKNHPSQKVKLAITDIDGVLRGKYISTEKFLSVVEGNLGFCDVVFGWDSSDVAYDNVTYTGWHTGYPDAKAKLDLNTFRKIPWENDVPFFLCEFVNAEEKPLAVCPRQLLRKVIGDVERAGNSIIVSQEFEWFNFSETPASVHEKEGAIFE